MTHPEQPSGSSRVSAKTITIGVAVLILVAAVAVLATLLATRSDDSTTAASPSSTSTATSATTMTTSISTTTAQPPATTAVAPQIATTTTAPPAPAAKLPAVYDCNNVPHVRPADISSLFCADDGVNITGISWTSWTQTNAYGNGTENKRICEPNCAEGREEHSPVQVKLVEPMDGGFTRAIVTHRDGRTQSYSLVK